MKRPRDDETISLPKIRRMKNTKGGKLARKVEENDRLTSLAKDLKLVLVSFLTRSETLRLASCSISLKRELTSNEVWKVFIKGLSPSLLALPMKSVTNWRDKLKVIVLKRLEPQLEYNYKLLQLHYVLKINGVEYSATLSNPCSFNLGDISYSIKFQCELKFKSLIEEFHDHDDISLLVLLIYDGKTTVLIPEAKIELEKIEPPYHYVHVVKDMHILIVLNFKYCWHYSPGSSDDESSEEEETWCISGITSIEFVFDEGWGLKDTLNTKLTRSAEQLRWY